MGNDELFSIVWDNFRTTNDNFEYFERVLKGQKSDILRLKRSLKRTNKMQLLVGIEFLMMAKLWFDHEKRVTKLEKEQLKRKKKEDVCPVFEEENDCDFVEI